MDWLPYYYPSGGVGYATCAGDCRDPAAWQRIAIGTTQYIEWSYGIGVDNGIIYIAYTEYFPCTEHRVHKVSYCSNSCLNSASWSTIPIFSAQSSSSVNAYRTKGGKHILAVREHISNTNVQNQKLAICEANCNQSNSWTTFVVGSGEFSWFAAADFSINSRYSVAYKNGNSVNVIVCEGNCTSSQSWQHSHTDNTASDYPSLVCTNDGLFLANSKVENNLYYSLYLAHCANSCSQSGN